MPEETYQKSRRKTRILIAGILFLLAALIYAGTQLFPEPAARQFSLPSYTKADFDALDAEFERELRASEQEVEALFADRERVPLSERHLIPAGDVKSTQDLGREVLAFRMRELETFRSQTADAGEAKRLGEQFLEEYLKLVSLTQGFLTPEEIEKIGSQAFQAKADDPMLRVYYAGSLFKLGRFEEASQVLPDPEPFLANESYPAITKLTLCYWLWTIDRDNDQRLLGKTDIPHRLINAIVDYLTDEADFENQRLVFIPAESAMDTANVASWKLLYTAVLQAEGIHPWIRHMIAGRYYVKLAWERRGTDYADRVTPEQWEGFHKYLPRGAAHLRRAWQLHPEYPEAASGLVTVARADPDMRWSAREWFHEATSAQFDYQPAYGALVTSLQPRWGGSLESLIEFGEACLNTDRWDSRIPSYTNIVLVTLESELDPADYSQVPGFTSLMVRFTERLLEVTEEKPGIPGDDVDTWVSLVTTLIKMDDQHALVRRIFEHRGDWFDDQHFTTTGQRLASLRGRAYALTGPAKEVVGQLREALTRSLSNSPPPDFFQQVRELVEQAQQLDEQPEAQHYYRTVALIIDQLAQFQSDEWVDLEFDDDLVGWFVRGQVKMGEDNSLWLSNAKHDVGSKLSPLTPFSPPYVIEAELAGWAAETCKSDWTAMIIGPAVWYLSGDRPTQQRRILIGTYREYVMVTVGGENGVERVRALAAKPFHKIEARLEPGRFQVFVDGTLQHEDLQMPERLSGEITFGDICPTDQPGALKVRNVRIRRITDTSAEAD